MGLSEKQKQIVESKESKIVINAAAAAGKTCVVTERVKWLLDQGVKSSKIVVITFTKAAATEMRTRLGNHGQNIFIGTIHAYANYLLIANGIDTSSWIKNDDFDALFKLIQLYPDSLQEVEWLLLDEAQDTNEQQYHFIFDLIKPKNFFVCGDTRQCIYGWNGSRPDLFYNLSRRADVKTYELNENYRNGKDILNFANWILRVKANYYATNFYYSDNSIAMSEITGKKMEMVYDVQQIIDLIKKSNSYKDWFILCRENRQLDTIYKLLAEKGIPCTSFKRKDLTNEDLEILLNEDSIKILTIHTSKGLEAKYVVVIGAHMYNEEECRVAYVAATRAKNLLIWVKGDRPRWRKKETSKIKSWG